MLLGIDIGGTKCALVRAEVVDGQVRIVEKRRFETRGVTETLDEIFRTADELLPFDAIGISCGGPLDEERGVIMSPPNLPGWNGVTIVEMLNSRFGVPVKLLNDANACALAEWRFGAGKGTRNMVFLTFGTGLGAGIILDGELYSGTNGNAGEVGHIRLTDGGPVGFGKAGSFEGFCSGGGISKLNALMNPEEGCEGIDAKALAERARAGDAKALAVFEKSAEMLGKGLAIIADVLNPERIVIGSVFARAEDLFRPRMERVLESEALAESLSVLRVVPAELGEQIGDFAAVAVAKMAYESPDASRKIREYKYTDELVERYPALLPCKPFVIEAINEIVASCDRGGKVLLAGNGGSAADCEHISGEFLKGFLMKREPVGEEAEALVRVLGANGMKLQRGIGAIPLTSLSAALSAFANDVEPELVFAQLVYALGKKGDVLIGISTSGNSKNVLRAAKCASALGIKSVALVGDGGGALSEVCDVVIKVPERETFKVQELHLPVYHAICADVEAILFGNTK